MIALCKEQHLPEPEFIEKKEGIGEFTVIFRKDIFNEENLRKLGLNERQIKAVLYAKKNRKITNKEYQELTKVSKAMATIDLRELVKYGIFEKKGVTGKGTEYLLGNG